MALPKRTLANLDEEFARYRALMDKEIAILKAEQDKAREERGELRNLIVGSTERLAQQLLANGERADAAQRRSSAIARRLRAILALLGGNGDED